MAVIHLSTQINAPIETCFDLARSIDAHKQSTSKTKEKAIEGKTTGLIEEGETVTWQATHFGIRQKLTIKITKMERPHFFEDVMLQGAFKSMRHKHSFEAYDRGTTMHDEFYYETPLGILGKFFDMLILKSYMTRFLKQRNLYLKQTAESKNPKVVN
jgi:ligand-binding SRPBCC domain-containing protein